MGAPQDPIEVHSGDRWWITAPSAHRSYDAAQPVEVPEMFRALGMDQSHIIRPDPGDLWVCDFCNAEIPLVVLDGPGEGSEGFVPMLGSNALCPRCLLEEARRLELVQAGGRFQTSDWGLMFCACPPCAERIEALAERH